MRTNNEFGRAFREVRVAKKLTQEDFANQSGRTYISELERGVKHPTLKKIDELSERLGVHPLTTLVMAYLSYQDELELESLLQLVQHQVSEVLDAGPKRNAG
jgi:transcriptional regulator with XRE-family HTH domain